MLIMCANVSNISDMLGVLWLLCDQWNVVDDDDDYDDDDYDDDDDDAVEFFQLFVTLRAKLSSSVYCNRSCLWVCLCVFVGLLPR